MKQNKKQYNHQKLIETLPSRIKFVDINLLKENPKDAFRLDKKHSDRVKRQLEAFVIMGLSVNAKKANSIQFNAILF